MFLAKGISSNWRRPIAHQRPGLDCSFNDLVCDANRSIKSRWSGFYDMKGYAGFYRIHHIVIWGLWSKVSCARAQPFICRSTTVIESQRGMWHILIWSIREQINDRESSFPSPIPSLTWLTLPNRHRPHPGKLVGARPHGATLFLFDQQYLETSTKTMRRAVGEYSAIIGGSRYVDHRGLCHGGAEELW